MSDAQENGVKRYDQVDTSRNYMHSFDMEEDSTGAWVKYDDHLAEMQTKDDDIQSLYKTIAELKRVNEKLAKTIEESKAVWDAAYVEGLPEAMNEARAGNSAKLLDLLDRRLLFALAPLVYAELEKEGQG